MLQHKTPALKELAQKCGTLAGFNGENTMPAAKTPTVTENVMLFQRNVPAKRNKDYAIVDAPELFRLLGQLETQSKQLQGGMDTLSKAIAENNVVTNQIKNQLDILSNNYGAVEASALEAKTLATEAKSIAQQAHDRLNKIVISAMAFGAGAAIVVSLFIGPISDMMRKFLHVIHVMGNSGAGVP